VIVEFFNSFILKLTIISKLMSKIRFNSVFLLRLTRHNDYMAKTSRVCDQIIF